MNHSERTILIDRLDRSYQAMPAWARMACRHSLGAPNINPETGKEFTSFREVMEAASDWTLEILKDDFEGNGDLLL